MIDYLQYFLAWTLLSAVIIHHERKKAMTYVTLGIFTVLSASIAEPLGKLAGFWSYNAGPLFLGANVFTILNYFNYIIAAYFVSEKFMERLA